MLEASQGENNALCGCLRKLSRDSTAPLQNAEFYFSIKRSEFARQFAKMLEKPDINKFSSSDFHTASSQIQNSNADGFWTRFFHPPIQIFCFFPESVQVRQRRSLLHLTRLCCCQSVNNGSFSFYCIFSPSCFPSAFLMSEKAAAGPVPATGSHCSFHAPPAKVRHPVLSLSH